MRDAGNLCTLIHSRSQCKGCFLLCGSALFPLLLLTRVFSYKRPFAFPSLPALWLRQEQVSKLRDERETAARDIAVLRADLDNTRQERERAVAEAARSKEELDKWVRGWGYGRRGAAAVYVKLSGRGCRERCGALLGHRF